jgi:acetyltransferase-like isoleucine patch superfamily enzyme
MKYFCHNLSDVNSEKIGAGTTIWQFVVVLPGAVIGKNCNINSHVFIENDVVIGNNVTLKSGVQVWDGITLEDNVFIGPNVTFTNDLVPRSKQYPQSFEKTLVKKGASIGANATIIAGNEIGEYSLIGAGTVITKNVPARALVVGNPMKLIGWLNNDGTKMKQFDDCFVDSNNVSWIVNNNRLVKK